MVWYNLTVDDISPLISYEGNWGSLTMRNPGDEASTIQTFHNNTLHVLSSAGSAKLQFVGRAISVWGPSRPDSSQYEVRLDDLVVEKGELSTKSNESTLLFGVSDLAPGSLHTLQITNDPLDPQRPWLRIDRFVVESGTDGSDDIETTTMDDSDSSIHYTVNKRRWSSETGEQSAYHDGTFHATNTNRASLGFTTEGDSVEIYGSQNSGFSSFAVTVDGIQRNFTPNVRDFQSPVLLFQTEFFQTGVQHTIQVDILENKRFEFDFVRVMKHRGSSQPTDSEGASLNNGGVQTALTSSSSFDARLSGPAIAGIVFGCLAMLVLVILALLLWCRKKRRRLSPSAAFMAGLNMDLPQKSTPIYEEFSSVYRSPSNGTREQSTKRGMDLLDGQPEPTSDERSKYEPYLLMYKTGAVRSKYEATLRPEDSASFHVRSPPASEVGSQTQGDHVTRFTPTVSLPPRLS